MVNINEEMLCLDDITHLDENCILHILNTVSLNSVTVPATLFPFVAGKAIISLDTGLQKTSVMCALAMLNKVVSPNKKVLMIIPKEATHNVDKIKLWVKPLTCGLITAELTVEERIHEFMRNVDVLIITPRLMFSPVFVNTWLLYLKDSVSQIIVDEAHFANLTTQGGYMLRYLSENTERFFMLTATPGSKLKQFEFLCSLCNPELPYYSHTRKDIGIEDEYNVDVITVPEYSIINEYTNAPDVNSYRKFREYIPPNSTLMQKFLDRASQECDGLFTTGLVYTRFRNAQSEMDKYLTEQEIFHEVLNADSSIAHRSYVGSNLPQLTLSTLTTAIDIPSNNLYVWGWCHDMIQLVGRLNRTYDSKTINITIQLLDSEIESTLESCYETLELQEVTSKSTQLFRKIINLLEGR